ncbi:MAG TPA: ParB N-terminal domain-containing protein [Geobacterales bacterium]|nr:ParB N-terminal domain-containing protein [Geobacterales bacterium]
MISDEDSITLNYSGFRSVITLMPIQELVPHEEVNEIHLNELVFLLKSDPFLNDPIIVDERSHVVLDGMHRLEALKKLGLRFAPCMLVNYNDERIQVDKWVREAYIKNEINIGDLFNDLIKNIEDEMILSMKVGEEIFSDLKMNDLLKRNFFIILNNILLYIEKINLEKNIKLVKYLDDKLNVTQFIAFEDLSSVKKRKSESIFFSGRIVEKNEIINQAKVGRLFPPKTTRHILPYRVKNLKVPLSFLLERDLRNARSKFMAWLDGRKIEIKVG